MPAVNDRIRLMAKAKRLGVADYKGMSVDELRVAVEDADHATAKDAEFDGAATGKVARSKGKTSASKPARSKGKTTSTRKSAPAKSTTRKSAATAAAKGTAKRSTAAGKTRPASKRKSATSKVASRVRTATAKTATSKRKSVVKPVGRPAARKTASAKTTAVRKAATARANGVKRAPLSNAIDWNAESTVGQTGKRKTVLNALREKQGDKRAVFTKLRRYATVWYPDKTEGDAEKMLVWLIARVAYDFALKSGQHEQGTRDAYGESETPQNVRRREARAQASNGSRKRSTRKTAVAAGTRKRSAAKGKTTASKTSTAKAKSAGKRGSAKRGLAARR